MRRLFLLPLLAVLLGGVLPAATIQFDVINIGQNNYRYTYVVSGMTFAANQELDVKFDPALFLSLSNPHAPSGFSALVFQPNNPPGFGIFGDFSALATVNNPALSPFSVDVIFLGQGLPGAQSFEINQYDSNLNFVGTLASGTTVPNGGVTATPEPSSFVLGGLGTLLGLAWCAVRRRSGAAV